MENCLKPNNPESIEYQLRTRKIAHSKRVGAFVYIKESYIKTAQKYGAPLTEEAVEWNKKMVKYYGPAIIIY